jgi:hypothetical protein
MTLTSINRPAFAATLELAALTGSNFVPPEGWPAGEHRPAVALIFRALGPAVDPGGSAALSRNTAAHPLHARFANISGASISDATMRPNPRSTRSW